jgi:uncharacterized membrane protein
MKTLSIYAFVFLLGIAFAQAIYYYPMMPETMAIHFRGDGKADNFASRESFYIIYAIIFLLITGIFVFLPRGLQKIRPTTISLPNPDYWLKPERIDEVHRYLWNWMCWFGVANLILLIGVCQLVFKANMEPGFVLDNRIFFTLIISYFVFVIIWLIVFYRKFKKVD